MAKVYSGPIELNGKSYEIDGPLYKQRVVEFPEAAPQDSAQTRQTRRFLQSFSIGTINGLLVERDYDNDLSMCYDCSLETRFPGQITLSGLWTAEGGFTVVNQSTDWDIRGGISFDGKVFISHAYDDTGGNVHYLYGRYYDTSDEDWLLTETIQSQTDAANDYDFIPHDLKVHGIYLFSVHATPTAADAWSRYLRRRAVGGAFADPSVSADFPTAMTNADDESLLCSIAGTLYLAVWISSTGVVTIHRSLDAGVTWTAAASTTLVTANPPTAFVGYTNDDGIEVPHLGTSEGVYRYDMDGDNPTMIIDLHDRSDADNCRGMVAWDQTGALYTPIAGTPYGQLLEYRIQDGVRIIRHVGLNLGSGLSSNWANKKGEIFILTPAGSWLFAVIRDGSAVSTACAVLAFDSRGWHHIFGSGWAGSSTRAGYGPLGTLPQALCFSADRIHLVWKAAATTADAAHSLYPLQNPLTTSSFVYLDEGLIYIPRFAGGLAEIPAVWLQAHVDAENLDTAATEYILFKYGLDGEVATTNTAGTAAQAGKFISGVTTLGLATTGVGESSKTLAPYLYFHRGDTTTETPKLYNFSIDYLKVPTVRHYYRMVIDIKATESPGSRTREQIYAELDTLEALVTQATFSFPGVSTVYVKVMEPTPGITFEGSDMPNVLRKYTPGEDKVELILLELI